MYFCLFIFFSLKKQKSTKSQVINVLMLMSSVENILYSLCSFIYAKLMAILYERKTVCMYIAARPFICSSFILYKFSYIREKRNDELRRFQIGNCSKYWQIPNYMPWAISFFILSLFLLRIHTYISFHSIVSWTISTTHSCPFHHVQEWF